MNILRWSAIFITALLAAGQIHAAPGGNQGRGGGNSGGGNGGGDEGGGDGGDAGNPTCASHSYFPSLAFVRSSGSRNLDRDLMLASADGACTLSVHAIRPSKSWLTTNVWQTELVSDIVVEEDGIRHGIVAWLEQETLNRDRTEYRWAIKAVRFSVDAAGQFSQSPGGAETLFQVIEDRNSAARTMLHYSGLALSSDGKRLAFLSIPDASPWPSEDVRVPMVCELPGCSTLTAVADPGWYESPAWDQEGALFFVRRGASTSTLPDDSQTWVMSAHPDQDGQWMSSDSLELNGLAGYVTSLELTRGGVERLAVQDRGPAPDYHQPVRVYTRQEDGSWNPGWVYAFDEYTSGIRHKWTRRGQLTVRDEDGSSLDESLLFAITLNGVYTPWEWAPTSGSTQQSSYPVDLRFVWDAD